MSNLDPITKQVIRNATRAAATEMQTTLIIQKLKSYIIKATRLAPYH